MTLPKELSARACERCRVSSSHAQGPPGLSSRAANDDLAAEGFQSVTAGGLGSHTSVLLTACLEQPSIRRISRILCPLLARSTSRSSSPDRFASTPCPLSRIHQRWAFSPRHSADLLSRPISADPTLNLSRVDVP